MLVSFKDLALNTKKDIYWDIFDFNNNISNHFYFVNKNQCQLYINLKDN